MNTLHGDIIEIPSRRSYELSLFSSKVGSSHGVGGVVARERSSSVSIGDLWPEIDSAEGVGGGDATATATRGHLEASSPRCLSYGEMKVKAKVVVD